MQEPAGYSAQFLAQTLTVITKGISILIRPVTTVGLIADSSVKAAIRSLTRERPECGRSSHWALPLFATMSIHLRKLTLSKGSAASNTYPTLRIWKG